MKRARSGPLGFELAAEQFRAGNKRAARSTCLVLLSQNPRDARALYLLGTLELEAGQADRAVTHLERAVSLVPGAAPFLCNLGLAYAKLPDLERARDAFVRALAADPNLADAIQNLGLVELDRGEVGEALVHLARAAVLRPKSFAVQRGYARALARASRTDEALERYRIAVALEPADAATQRDLAFLILKLGCLEEGLSVLERAVELDPKARTAHSRLVFHAPFSPRYGAERVLETARRFGEAQEKSPVNCRAPHANERSSDRRLRIGYVSPEFRDHAQRLFTMPVLREHDHDAFEIFCYSSTTPEDDWTARIREQADVWRDVVRSSDAELAQRIREDRIDVLVDLNMHMGGERLRVFVEKPAPVQIAWLAYPGTTGIAEIDYRISDPHLDPPGAPLPYSEQTLLLPDCFWCYDPGSEEPRVNELPALDSGRITFGCLNNFLKVNTGVLELWARTLAALPDSRLLLLAPSEQARAFASEVLTSHGLAPERVEFLPLMWRKDYLAAYHRIDIALDCFPYNGHTTSLDAFWMGVPVVTLVGNTVVGRAGLCQATLLGLPELIADDPDQFVKNVVALARDQPRLAELRQGLRDRLQRSALMDAPKFTRALEALYREAFRRWCHSTRLMT
jgi:predicted O-linked N-acetylglucosamine transferase (SPINDLY family)